VQASLPSIEGQSGIVMEVNTKKILYEKNVEQNLPMASTTKILTALVAIEKGNLQKKIVTPYLTYFTFYNLHYFYQIYIKICII
jgi:D-alanyl-D-alanine carboxypeptidase